MQALNLFDSINKLTNWSDKHFFALESREIENSSALLKKEQGKQDHIPHQN